MDRIKIIRVEDGGHFGRTNESREQLRAKTGEVGRDQFVSGSQ